MSGSADGIYPILDAAWAASLAPDSLAHRLHTCGITILQLRCKSGGGALYRFARAWIPVLRRHAPGVRVIINDRADVALDLQADGVHVGQDDISPEACRKLLGPDALIGLSTHTLDEVRAAAGRPVDYIGFGPLFATGTKPDALDPRPDGLLAEICAVSALPVVGIGGITLERLPWVRGQGAQSAAMIGALWQSDWSHRLARAVQIWDGVAH